jgi:hypothetical protein
MKCIKCDTELENTGEKFTGVCNYGYGQFISFYYCPNENCLRYKLYCMHITREHRS